jgi:hypothetical protein
VGRSWGKGPARGARSVYIWAAAIRFSLKYLCKFLILCEIVIFWRLKNNGFPIRFSAFVSPK